MGPMRAGIFVSETRDAASDVKQARERVRRAEALGFPAGWVPHRPWFCDAARQRPGRGEVLRRHGGDLGTDGRVPGGALKRR
jgi:hypothetical protein